MLCTLLVCCWQWQCHIVTNSGDCLCLETHTLTHSNLVYPFGHVLVRWDFQHLIDEGSQNLWHPLPPPPWFYLFAVCLPSPFLLNSFQVSVCVDENWFPCQSYGSYSFSFLRRDTEFSVQVSPTLSSCSYPHLILRISASLSADSVLQTQYLYLVNFVVAKA